VKVCTSESEKTLTSQAFGLGPLLSRKDGRGAEGHGFTKRSRYRREKARAVSRLRLVQPEQKLLEHVERTYFAVHLESLAERIADAGMHRRRRDLHEAP
jgi:hypothetical protein